MSHEHRAGWRSKSSNHPARVRVVNKTCASAAPQTGLMRNQPDLSSRRSGHYEIGAHLPYLIFVENRCQLLLIHPLFSQLSAALYFLFHLSFGFCCMACEILKFVLPCLNLLSSYPTSVLLLSLCNLHSSFPFTLAYL